eukprot:COSAG04_NODE_350_length_16101_cov_52.309923_2_plen_1070_part_00
MFNHGTGRVDPRPLPSTVRVGSHDHFDGDSGHWRDHAIPGTIDGGTIHFRNVTSEHTIVAWQPPDQGLYKWDVLGFRVEWRLEGQPWPQPGEGGATEQGGAADVMTPEGSASTGTTCNCVLVRTWPGKGLYFFRIRSWNHGGSAPWSEESYGLWPPEPPQPPKELAASRLPTTGFNISWAPALTVGTEHCADVARRDVPAGVCTTRGAGLPVDSYRLEIRLPGTERWQPAVRLPGLARGVMRSAAGVRGQVRSCKCRSRPRLLTASTSQVHLAVDPDMKRLPADSTFGFRVSAHNAAGWSEPSEVLDARSFGPPARLRSPVAFTESGETFLRLAWAAPRLGADGSPLKNPIVRYRVFGSSFNERLGTWQAAARGSLTSNTRRPFAASPLDAPVPAPESLPADTWLEFFFGYSGDTVTPDADGNVHYLADFLSPGTMYRFVVFAVSDSGEAEPSVPSQPMATLIQPPGDVRLFVGAPCVHKDVSTPVEFLAMSSGKDVRFTWQLPEGGPIGRCHQSGCAAMEYTLPAAGPHPQGPTDAFEVAVLASNKRGIVRTETAVHVEYCGCTDAMDPSYDADADYMLPRSCDRTVSWDGAPSELILDQVVPFQVHFDPLSTFAVELVLRVDVGQVATCYSTKKPPSEFGKSPAPLFDHPFARHDWGWDNVVVHQPDNAPPPPPPAPPPPPQTPVQVPGSEIDGEHCALGITNYRVITVPYARLAPSRRQKREGTPPASLFVGLKGTAAFSRFELLARPLSFGGMPRTSMKRDKEATGPHTTGVHDGTVARGMWTFWDIPLGRLGLADLEMRITVDRGCVSLYSSWTEVWPSPQRATKSSAGYERGLEHIGADCDGAGSGDGSGRLWTTIRPLTEDLRRTLHIGIAGASSASSYQLEVLRHDYAGYDRPSRLVEGMPAAGVSSTNPDRVLGFAKMEFFELHASGNVALLNLDVRIGQLELFCATAGLPARGRFAKRWRLPAQQHHSILVPIVRDCGAVVHNSSEPEFWPEAAVDRDDALRDRISLRGSVTGSHGERTSVYIGVLGTGEDLGAAEGNLFQIRAASAEDALAAAQAAGR